MSGSCCGVWGIVLLLHCHGILMRRLGCVTWDEIVELVVQSRRWPGGCDSQYHKAGKLICNCGIKVIMVCLV